MSDLRQFLFEPGSKPNAEIENKDPLAKGPYADDGERRFNDTPKFQNEDSSSRQRRPQSTQQVASTAARADATPEKKRPPRNDAAFANTNSNINYSTNANILLSEKSQPPRLTPSAQDESSLKLILEEFVSKTSVTDFQHLNVSSKVIIANSIPADESERKTNQILSRFMNSQNQNYPQNHPVAGGQPPSMPPPARASAESKPSDHSDLAPSSPQLKDNSPLQILTSQ